MTARLLLVASLLWAAVADAPVKLRVMPDVCIAPCEVLVQAFPEDDRIETLDVSLWLGDFKKSGSSYDRDHWVERHPPYILDEPGDWAIVAVGVDHEGAVIGRVETHVEVR